MTCLLAVIYLRTAVPRTEPVTSSLLIQGLTGLLGIKGPLRTQHSLQCATLRPVGTVGGPFLCPFVERLPRLCGLPRRVVLRSRWAMLSTIPAWTTSPHTSLPGRSCLGSAIRPELWSIAAACLKPSLRATRSRPTCEKFLCRGRDCRTQCRDVTREPLSAAWASRHIASAAYSLAGTLAKLESHPRNSTPHAVGIAVI
jgi:hypothetical protein